MATTLESTGEPPPDNLRVLGPDEQADQLLLELAPALVDLRDLKLTLTFTCGTVLHRAASVAPYKDSDHEVLTTTTVFFALMDYAVGLASGTKHADLSEAQELHALRAWGDHLKNNPDQIKQLNELIADAFDGHLLPGPALSLPPTFVRLSTGIAPDLRRVFEQLDGQYPIRTDMLGRTLLERPGQQLGARIARFGLGPLVDFVLGDDEPTQDVPKAATGPADGPSPTPSPDTPRPRRSARIQREADDDELGLGIEQYARALATIMRTAQGEFAFALFGPWGSGKTTLAKQTTPLLESATAFREGQNFSDGDPIASRNYAVVWHSAWKYRRTPEAWIFLYKSLADHAKKTSGLLGHFAIALRASSLLHGPWPLFLSLAAVAVAALPLLAKLHLAAALASLVGLAGVLYLLSVVGGTMHKVKALFSKHVKLSSHDDKLGMLALLGDDVRALLGAWIPATHVGSDAERAQARRRMWRDTSVAAAFILVVSFVWGLGLYLESRPKPDATGAVSKLQQTLSEVAKPACDVGIFEPTSVFCAKSDVGKEIEPAERGAVSPLHVSFFLLWLFLVMVLLLFPLFYRRGVPDRIMLIVDDLDRCNPDEMLEIVEALKLLLEEPFVQQRLQALMLVDEDVLEHAIVQRFTRLIEERSAIIARERDAPQGDAIATAAAKRQVVAEHVEKLFACHLRVPQLGEGEMAEAVELHAGRELRAQVREAMAELEASAQKGDALARTNQEIREEIEHLTPPDRPVFRQLQLDKMLEAQKKIDDVQATSASLLEQARRALRRPEVPDVSFSDSDLRFRREEIDVVKGLVPAYFAATHRRPSQRAIKALLFKIQLCHLLLQLRAGDAPSPEVAIEWIVDALSGRKNESTATGRAVGMVAAQVA